MTLNLYQQKVLNQYHYKIAKYLKWIFSREDDGYYLHCEYCNKRVAFLSNTVKQTIDPGDNFMLYILQEYFTPHIADRLHRQNVILYKLSGDSDER